MFGAALLAAVEAARTWDAAGAASCAPARCCALCHGRYRVLTIDGPLRDLPHVVAHVAVVTVDAVIDERVGGLQAGLDRGSGGAVLDVSHHGREPIRRRAARGGLLLAAMEELGAEQTELDRLRRSSMDRAMTALLAGARFDDLPDAWT